MQEETEDAEWPDEVDVPPDVPARVRFQRYQSLKSFRTTPWDPYENLPPEYARIFRFTNLRATRRRVLEKRTNLPVNVCAATIWRYLLAPTLRYAS